MINKSTLRKFLSEDSSEVNNEGINTGGFKNTEGFNSISGAIGNNPNPSNPNPSTGVSTSEGGKILDVEEERRRLRQLLFAPSLVGRRQFIGA